MNLLPYQQQEQQQKNGIKRSCSWSSSGICLHNSSTQNLITIPLTMRIITNKTVPQNSIDGNNYLFTCNSKNRLASPCSLLTISTPVMNAKPPIRSINTCHKVIQSEGTPNLTAKQNVLKDQESPGLNVFTPSSSPVIPTCIGDKSRPPFETVCLSSKSNSFIHQRSHSNTSSRISFTSSGDQRDQSIISPSQHQQGGKSTIRPCSVSFSRIPSGTNQHFTYSSSQQHPPHQFLSNSAKLLISAFQKQKDKIQKQTKPSSSCSLTSTSTQSTCRALSARLLTCSSIDEGKAYKVPQQQVNLNIQTSLSNCQIIPHSHEQTFSLSTLTQIPPGCCALAKISSRQVTSPEEKHKIAQFAKKASIEEIEEKRGQHSRRNISKTEEKDEEIELKELKIFRDQSSEDDVSIMKRKRNYDTQNNLTEINSLTKSQTILEGCSQQVQHQEGKIPKREVNIDTSKYKKNDQGSLESREIIDSKFEKLLKRWNENNNQVESEDVMIAQHKQVFTELEEQKEAEFAVSTISDQSGAEKQAQTIFSLLSQEQKTKFLERILSQRKNPSICDIPEYEPCEQQIQANSQTNQHYVQLENDERGLNVRTDTEEYCVAVQTHPDEKLQTEEENKEQSLLQSQLLSSSLNQEQVEECLLQKDIKDDSQEFKLEEQLIMKDEEITTCDIQEYLTLEQIKQQQQLDKKDDEDIFKVSQQINILGDGNQNQIKIKERRQLSLQSSPLLRINRDYQDAQTSPIRAISCTNSIKTTLQTQDMQTFFDEESSNKTNEQNYTPNNKNNLKNTGNLNDNSNSNVRTASSSKRDITHGVLNSSSASNISNTILSQSMQMLALQKREEILERIKCIDAQILLHQQTQQRHKTPTNKLIILNSDRGQLKQSQNIELSAKKHLGFKSFKQQTPTQASQRQMTPQGKQSFQLRASTPSARTSQESQFPSKKQVDSARSQKNNKQNINLLDGYDLKMQSSSKKVQGFVILADQPAKSHKWETMQIQRNLWDQGQRRDLRFTEISQTDKNQKENKDSSLNQKAIVIKNNQGLDKIGLLRSSSIKNTKKESDAAGLGVINLVEQNMKGTFKPSQDEDNNPMTRTPRLSWSNCQQTSQFVKDTPQSFNIEGYTGISRKKASFGSQNNKQKTPNRCQSQSAAMTFSIIPHTQELDLEALHLMKLAKQTKEVEFKKQKANNLDSRISKSMKTQQVQLNQNQDTLEDYSPIIQQHTKEEDMSDISGLNPITPISNLNTHS